MAEDATRGGMASGLGWFSLGLGVPALLAPGAVARVAGLDPTSGTTAVIRGVGIQELTTGAGILRRDRPVAWLWSRVAGDLAHISLLWGAVQDSRGDATKVRRAIAAIAGVTALDVAAAARAARSGPRPTLEASGAVTINRPPAEVYRRWRDLESLPAFMDHLREVQVLDERRSRWVANAPAGRTVTWDAEIVEDRPDQVVRWRSAEGATVENHGEVRFAPAPGDQGTEVHLEVHYDPPAGRLGVAVARLLGEEPRQQVADDLRRFKQILETGQVTVSDGSPDGARSLRQLAQRPARPADPEER